MKNYEISIKNDEVIDKIFFKKYRCLEKIGQGSFGPIHKAIYNNKYYALKFENTQNNYENILENEAKMMINLKGPHIPFIKTYGKSGDFNIIVMQLLGKDLQSLLSEVGKFSIKTVCLLAYQMISIIEHIHSKNVIHRNLKPENFLMGLEQNAKFVYLIDYGLSKYCNNNIIEGKKLTGTPRYASINALKGIEQSKRDDLESIGYILVYLAKGKLPWQGIKCDVKNKKMKNILVKKIEMSSADLCLGLPSEFIEYIDYCKNLEFNCKPKYQMLKNFFVQIIEKQNKAFDYIYDWTNIEEWNRIKSNPNKLKDEVKTNSYVKTDIVKKKEKKICAICTDSEVNCKILDCLHEICKNCYSRLENICPFCRKELKGIIEEPNVIKES